MPQERVNTELNELQKRVHQQQEEIELLKGVIDMLPGSVYWKDINGVYLGRNQYSIDIMYRVGLGKDFEDDLMIGKTDYDLFTKEIADQYR